jgi:acetolactate decarboxylase
MKRFRVLSAALLCMVFLFPVFPVAGEPLRSVYQVSNLTALRNGAYDGFVTVAELRTHGDFGIGTVHGLNGEMVALGGRFYLVTVDGTVHTLTGTERAPFAMVTRFQPTGAAEVKSDDATGLEELRKSLDRMIRPGSGIYAVQVHGVFRTLTLRSVPRREKPYPPLADVIKEQKVFAFEHVTGTMVGFRFPAYMAGVNAPGYHFHFIGAGQKIGGHVLDCAVSKGKASWSRVERFVMDPGPPED